MRTGPAIIGVGAGLSVALAALSGFMPLTENSPLSASLLYGGTTDDLPEQAPEGCEDCQGALDNYWDLKRKADDLPYIPPYLQDEIDTARQNYLDCLKDCAPEPTPEPTKEPRPLSVSLSGPAETVVDCVTPPIEADVSGGIEPYSYEWSSSAGIGGSGGPAVSFISRDSGKQWARVKVTDANDASASAVHTIVVNEPYSVSSGSSRYVYGELVQVSDEYVGAKPSGSTITFTIKRSHVFTNRINVELAVPIYIVTAKVQYQGDRSYDVTSETAQQYYVPPGEARALFAKARIKETTGRVRQYVCNKDYQEGDWHMAEFECWRWEFMEP